MGQSSIHKYKCRSSRHTMGQSSIQTYKCMSSRNTVGQSSIQKYKCMSSRNTVGQSSIQNTNVGVVLVGKQINLTTAPNGWWRGD